MPVAATVPVTDPARWRWRQLNTFWPSTFRERENANARFIVSCTYVETECHSLPVGLMVTTGRYVLLYVLKYVSGFFNVCEMSFWNASHCVWSGRLERGRWRRLWHCSRQSIYLVLISSLAWNSIQHDAHSHLGSSFQALIDYKLLHPIPVTLEFISADLLHLLIYVYVYVS